MKEDFLHYVWQLQLFKVKKLLSSNQEPVIILNKGQYNTNTGPDFFNAKVKIGNQLWAGNVEIHVKASDWYVHHHEIDSNYNSVILHVVWENDAEIFRSDNTVIPTLVLKDYIELFVLNNYRNLLSKKSKWINCEKHIAEVDSFILNNWLERLFIERLEQKALLMTSLLKESAHDWEAVLFVLLAKNFGLKVNGEAFLNMAKSVDFNVVRKVRADKQDLEALFLGMGNLLDKAVDINYYKTLKTQFDYLKVKFKLAPSLAHKIQFFRLRPDNFPTIRLAQLAALYSKHHNLFSLLIDVKTPEEIYKAFTVAVSDFWTSHYTFTSEKTGRRSKKLSKSFIDLLIINTIVPLQFVYQKHIGKSNSEKIIGLLQQIKPEKNSIITKFKALGLSVENAFKTQALLQLKNNYCAKNNCLQCKIGHNLIAN
jgi:uncharacterized protein DUF2851